MESMMKLPDDIVKPELEEDKQHMGMMTMMAMPY